MHFEVTGELLIGRRDIRGSAASTRPHRGPLEGLAGPSFDGASAAEVALACRLADEAVDDFALTTPEERALLLEAMAANLRMVGESGATLLSQEASLPLTVARTELARCIARLRWHAHVLRQGQLAHAEPFARSPRSSRSPTWLEGAPRSDHHVHRRPVGPVAFFCASTHPFVSLVPTEGFVAALAAGCPVVVRSHPMHAGTSELQGRALRHAIEQRALPEGIFSLLLGEGVDEWLVEHPAIRAAVCIGSASTDLPILRRGQTRRDPIPVYPARTTANPYFLLPDALNARAEAFARTFVERLVADIACAHTKPALLVAIDGDGLVELRDALASTITSLPATHFADLAIRELYEETTADPDGSLTEQRIAEGAPASDPTGGQARLFEIRATELLASVHEAEALFGPAVVLVRCDDAAQLMAVARALSGLATATVCMTTIDSDLARSLIPTLARRADRIVVRQPTFRSFPAGVSEAETEDTWAPEGGGETARFSRPVLYQGVPDELLPEELRDGNARASTRSDDEFGVRR